MNRKLTPKQSHTIRHLLVAKINLDAAKASIKRILPDRIIPPIFNGLVIIGENDHLIPPDYSGTLVILPAQDEPHE